MIGAKAVGIAAAAALFFYIFIRATRDLASKKLVIAEYQQVLESEEHKVKSRFDQ